MKREMKIEKKLKKEWRNIIFNIIFASSTILVVVLFYKNIILTTIFESIISIIGLIKWKSKLTLAIYVFGAFFGTFSEMFCIKYEVWNYSISNLINIPLWLFLVWGNAAAFIYQTAVEIKSLGVKK